jgi:hypothetical protein
MKDVATLVDQIIAGKVLQLAEKEKIQGKVLLDDQRE